jgi:cell division protein FtsW
MCGPFGFQPVEFAKVALIVFVAARVEFLGQEFKTLLRGFLPVAAAMGVLMGLLYMQPDFGSMVFVVGLGSLLLILGGARLAHFVGLAALAAPLCVWYVPRTLGHVTRRLAEFETVPVGSQLWQSLLALKSSGMSGSDLGAGAAKLGYLPMISNDFILAGIGDEMGFIGTSLVVMLFLLFTVLATRIVVAQRCPALFLLGAGVTISIAVQAVINIAVVTGAVPTKGIALPFVSVGGSSMALSLFGVGLLIGMARGGGEHGSRRMLGARLRDYLGGLTQTLRGRSDG